MMNVYVLEDKFGSMYIGITKDLTRRLRDHRVGEVATTRKLNFKSLRLTHFWVVPSYSWASRFERYLHSVSKATVLDLVLDCPHWNSVTEELAATKELQHSEREIDAGKVHRFYKNAFVSLPNEDQLARVK